MATNSLVSYTAPTGDGTTFYIETYTGTSLHSTVGSFNGLETIQPDVSYPFITTIDGHIAVDGGRDIWDTIAVASYFMFVTTSDNTGNPGDNSDDVVIDGVSNGDKQIYFPSITQAATLGTCYTVGGGPLDVIKTDRLRLIY